MNTLKVYLGISGRPDEDHQRVDGSCQWIEETKEFMKWRDSADGLSNDPLPEKGNRDNNPSILWIRANPGTGKTRLANPR
ncbi:hypothetical protein IMZ48_07785 [Candidatus Bathyarchaeota archaeon]|nr:hypothetical protein [Candidatus Bathyarchaeota archaeon]